MQSQYLPPALALAGWPIGFDELLPYYQRVQPLMDAGPYEYNVGYWRRTAGPVDDLTAAARRVSGAFSADPTLRGAPSGHTLDIREVRLAAGAEFVVMVCGDIMTLPGLPKVPAAELIDIDSQGRISGLS